MSQRKMMPAVPFRNWYTGGHSIISVQLRPLLSERWQASKCWPARPGPNPTGTEPDPVPLCCRQPIHFHPERRSSRPRLIPAPSSYISLSFRRNPAIRSGRSRSAGHCKIFVDIDGMATLTHSIEITVNVVYWQSACRTNILAGLAGRRSR